MKLTVSCQICGRVISICEKDSFSQYDMDNAVATSSCQVDGPFPSVDDEGNPLPLDTSNIVATKTNT